MLLMHDPLLLADPYFAWALLGVGESVVGSYFYCVHDRPSPVVRVGAASITVNASTRAEEAHVSYLPLPTRW